MVMRAVIPAIAFVAVVLVGCGAASSASHASPGGSTATAPAASSCSGQIRAWANAGGWRHLDSAAHLLTTMGKTADPASRDKSAGKVAAKLGDTKQLNTEAVFLSASAKLALTDLPPSCAPNMRTDYVTAMQDFKRAAAELKSGAYQAAISDMSAGGTAMSQAASAIP
jgi:hypothetical protein